MTPWAPQLQTNGNELTTGITYNIQNADLSILIRQIINKAGTGRPMLKITTLAGQIRYFTLSDTGIELLNVIRGSLGDVLDEYMNQIKELLDAAATLEIVNAQPGQRDLTGNSFFPFWCVSNHIHSRNKMERYQVFTKKQIYDKNVRPLFNDNCFVYSCKMSGLFNDAQLDHIKYQFNGRKDITTQAISKFCKEYKLLFLMRYINSDGKIKNKRYGDTSSTKMLELSQYQNHWFIHEIVPDPTCIGKPNCKKLNSLQLLHHLHQIGMLDPMKRDETTMLTNQFFSKKMEIGKLEVNEFNNRKYRLKPVRCCDRIAIHEWCTLCQSGVPDNTAPPPEPLSTWFCDFETYNDPTDHGTDLKPYMLFATASKDDNVTIPNVMTKFNDPNRSSLKQIGKYFDNLYRYSRGTPDMKQIIIRNYYHYLKFDFCQLLSVLDNYGNIDMLKKDNSVYQVRIRWKCSGYKDSKGKYVGGNMVTFDCRCTALMLNCSLQEASLTYLGQELKHPCIYEWYNKDNLNNMNPTIEEVAKTVTKGDMDQFLEFIKGTEHYNKHEGRLYMWSYYDDYCRQDCYVLRDIYKKFCELFIKVFDMDPRQSLTISSLSNKYCYNQGCYDGVYEMTGTIQQFCQQAVVGGRCMTADHKSYHVTKRTEDYDACSLYPSAMTRIGFPTGVPYVINDGSKLDRYAYYIIEIEVTSVGKNLPFPILSVIDESGNRHFTNNMTGQIIIADKTTLEDFVNYQDGSYKFIRGLGWRGVNNKISETIKYLYNLRLKYKSLPDDDPEYPIQQLIKLIMNSAYGKCIMKMSVSNTVLKTDQTKDPYIFNNYYNIRSIHQIGHHWLIDKYKEKNDHWNRAHVGASILSMSKRIMHEVMTTANDLDVDIYYTDTDSMQIDSAGLVGVENEFTKRYGRELKGKNLGNFHCDFTLKDENDKKLKNPYAIEGLYLGKKLLACRLNAKGEDDKIHEGYHLVMKGIPTSLTKWEHFIDLIQRKEVKYNLLDGIVGIRTTNFQSSIPKQFSRVVTAPDQELILI